MSIFEANPSAEFDVLEREVTQTNENTSRHTISDGEARHRNPLEDTFLECAWDSRQMFGSVTHHSNYPEVPVFVRHAHAAAPDLF